MVLVRYLGLRQLVAWLPGIDSVLDIGCFVHMLYKVPGATTSRADREAKHSSFEDGHTSSFCHFSLALSLTLSSFLLHHCNCYTHKNTEFALGNWRIDAEKLS